MTESFLAQACAEAHRRTEASQRVVSEAALRDRAAAQPPRADFAAALRAPGVSVIAEVKRASPSRGDLAAIPDAAALAAAYAEGGAAAVSVLTEPDHFKGSLDDLSEAAHAVDLPVIRKDFLVSGYQVWEAAATGAAAVLLIVAVLDDGALAELFAVTAEAGLGALVETHEAAEIDRAAAAHAAAGSPGTLVVGVNARNLVTLEVDLERFAALRAGVPADALAVAESGVKGPADVRRLSDQGAHAVLVGESVATAANPTDAVARLVMAGRRNAGARA